MKRADDYAQRRGRVADLSDDELRERFWELAGKVVDPLLKMGREHTSPSIERSVLLRMGFSSVEVKPIVEGAERRGLLSRGAGNVVYRLAKARGMEIREAGLALAEGRLWDEAAALFADEPGEVR